jgi:Ca2+-binding EF-hand superfamily protein
MHRKGEAKFAAADKDKDGTLDKEEAKAMPRVAKHFDEIDADKDGTVSKDEIHTFMKEHHKDKGKGMHTEMHKDMHGKDGHDMPMGEKK